MATPRGSRHAFVMTDVLAALTVLGGGILLALTFFQAEVREVRTTYERYAGLLLAESEIERLTTLPYHAITPGKDQSLTLSMPSAQKLKNVRGTLSVREIGPGLKEATVRVVWDTRRRHTRKVAMTRLFAREGRP